MFTLRSVLQNIRKRSLLSDAERFDSRYLRRRYLLSDAERSDSRYLRKRSFLSDAERFDSREHVTEILHLFVIRSNYVHTAIVYWNPTY